MCLETKDDPHPPTID